MQMKSYALLALAAFTLVAVGCGDKKTGGADGAPADAPADRLFDEKSGKVELKMTMMGMNVPMTLYFDDWGKKTATTMEMEMMGQKMSQRSVTMGDTTVQWDAKTMKGSRSTKGAGDMKSLAAYTNMSPERKKSLNYKDIEEKEVLGKKAKGFSIDTAGGTMKIWHWKNIPVYMEVTAQGMTVTMEATKIDVPGSVPADVFTIPAGIDFTADPMGGMGGGGGSTMGGDSGKGGSGVVIEGDSGAVETEGGDTTKKIQ